MVELTPKQIQKSIPIPRLRFHLAPFLFILSMSDHLHFHALPEATQPSILELPCDELKEIIDGLPKYGTIMYGAETRYWYIELPAEWSKVQDDIISVIKETFRDSPWYIESKQLCMCWNDMVNAVYPRKAPPAVIECVPPPSIVGMFHFGAIYLEYRF